MHITAIIVMTESILTHQQETFEYHVNHERIPVQIYLDSSEACQVIGDEIIQQINKKEVQAKLLFWGWLQGPRQSRCINILSEPIKPVK